jgi:hypothetical protein
MRPHESAVMVFPISKSNFSKPSDIQPPLSLPG